MMHLIYFFSERLINKFYVRKTIIRFAPISINYRVADPDLSGMFFLRSGSGIIIPNPDPTNIKTDF